MNEWLKLKYPIKISEIPDNFPRSIYELISKELELGNELNEILALVKDGSYKSMTIGFVYSFYNQLLKDKSRECRYSCYYEKIVSCVIKGCTIDYYGGKRTQVIKPINLIAPIPEENIPTFLPGDAYSVIIKEYELGNTLLYLQDQTGSPSENVFVGGFLHSFRVSTTFSLSDIDKKSGYERIICLKNDGQGCTIIRAGKLEAK